jgi:uncharacterized membrane protein YtjA (UPF0391 family)
MLRWALIFLVVAVLAYALGMGGVAGLSMDIAQILAILFVVLAVGSFLLHMFRGGRGTRV